MEIGEAVKHVDADVLSAAPDVVSNQIARMCDVLEHQYHDTVFVVIESVFVERLPSLCETVVRSKNVGDNSRSHIGPSATSQGLRSSNVEFIYELTPNFVITSALQ